jgi:gliding motility-associated-like protein
LYCIQVLLKPSIDSTLIDSTICFGDSVLFEGEIYTEPGQHCVTLVGSNGCDSVRCLVLAVSPLPIVELVLANLTDTVAFGDTVFMSIAAGNYETILWYANDSLLADCSGFTSCFHIPMDSTTYTVVVSDSTTCSGTASQSVFVLLACDPKEVEVPNAFSPNDDDLNDTFDIVGPGSESAINMRIWNRWGQKVYDGPGPWDGKQDGKPAASDVYIYIIKVGCQVPVDDMEEIFKGDVTLMR